MFTTPMVAGWLYPYVQNLIPEIASNAVPYAVAGDILVVVSLFVLGGDFWDEIRGLFVYSDKVCSASSLTPCGQS